uniref:ANK_REP_REGION domain-containing protein n=1 Tax=Caenorhabditis tropicalis TaxID=1561998 RepID=A0A1I7T3R2_9PELO
MTSRPSFPGIIERPRTLDFVPTRKTHFSPVKTSLSPQKEQDKEQDPPPSPKKAEDSEQEFPPTDSSVIGSTTPLDLKLDELKSPLENVLKEEEERENKERILTIRKEWKTRGMPDPREWPRLRAIPNYDEYPLVQKSSEQLREDIRKLKKRKSEKEDKEVDEAWEVIREYGSEDNRYEASELVEYRDHNWCVALRICREKMVDRVTHQLLVYSYQSGIQRLQLSNKQMDTLGETLLMRYKTNEDHSIEVLPIYSALPSTGLLSLKYRNNKGIELRVYGICNFIDFDKDVDQMTHKTMIWTDALGPIYLTNGDRSSIRRKMQMPEQKLFAPLRMCQITVKGDFNSNVLNGTFLKWSVASYTPLIEEAPKDPNIGRNFWPARVLRFDDLVKEFQKTGHQSSHFSTSNTGTWFRSISEPRIRVFAGTQLNGILQSAGPTYAEKGVMMALVVPCFHQLKFIYYEALIVGPPRVVMLITEGRYSNYNAKTLAPAIQKIQNSYRKEKPHIEAPFHHNHLKSLKGSEEFHFDF